MIKKLLSIALIFSGIIASAQSFTSTYSFTSVSATSGTIDPTPVPTATGLTFGSFSAVGTPTANPNAAGRFSFTGWPTGSTTGNDIYSTMTGSINLGEYYEVTLSPQAGYTVGLNTIGFTAQRSGTGIRSYVVKASADGFVTNLPAAVVSNTNISIVGTNEFFWVLDANNGAQNGSTINLFGATSATPVTFRFYAWNSEGSGGTFSIDNVVFDGTVTGVSTCTAPLVSSITSNGPICSSTSLLLQSTVTGSGPLTYSWAGAGSFNSTSISNPTVTGASGNYTLTVSNACGTVTSVYNPTITPTPTVSVNAASICSGGTATLTATGATTYSWSPSATLSSATGSVVTGNPTSTTIYTVVGTTGSCSVAATTSINVIASPTLAVNSTSICAGSSATLTASGVSTYTWTSPVSNSPSISVTPTGTTIYTVSGQAAGCAGTFTATGTVSVTPLPTLVFTPASATICAGQTATLSVSGVTSQTWAPGSQTTTAVSVTPTTSVTYSVTGSNSGCTNSNTVSVQVNPLPTIVTTSATVCAGKTATLTASGASTYTWNPGASTGSTYTVIPTGALTTYTVVGTSSLSCSKSANVNVIAVPNPTLNVTASATVICAGNSVTLTASGASTYTWTGSVTNGTAFTPTATASYTVTGTSPVASCTASAVSTVTVNTCAGIHENSNATVFSIYPNPNNGSFVIRSSVFPATVVMYDVTGKQVMRKEITEMETASNVSQFGNGIYYVSLSAENNSTNYKMIIAK